MRHVNAESRSPVDWAALLDALGGDQEILDEMVRLFVEFYPDQVRDMEAALAEGAPESVVSAAHRLKGSLSQLLAEDATSLAASIETHGCRGELAQATLVWGALKEEIQRLINSLEAWLEA